MEELNARLPKEDIWITELVRDFRRETGRTERSASRAKLISRGNRPRRHRCRRRLNKSKAEPVIDGVLVRGLYLFNPKQQEVVVDYFRNLVGLRVFAARSKQPVASDQASTTPNNTEWAFPYELRLDLRKPVKLP